MKLLKVCLFLVLALMLFAPSASPQASTATVSGTIRDQTAAVVPAASVTLTNSPTNVATKITANTVGFYFFPGVVPGPYTLVVEAAGMQKFEAALTVQVQQSAVVDAVLTSARGLPGPRPVPAVSRETSTSPSTA